MVSFDQKSCFVYVGTYTQTSTSLIERSEGMFVYSLDRDKGSMELVQAVTGVANPSYLALTPDHRFLYAVNELAEFKGQPGGGVSAFSVDPVSGKLELINSQPSLGADPCYVSVDAKHKFVWVANYNGGSAAILPIQEDGSLAAPSAVIQHEGHGVNPQRQEEPHVHSVVLDPGYQFALVADLGLDKISVYRTEDFYQRYEGKPVFEVNARPGAGPRHLAFHPNQQYVYVVHELDSTVSFYTFDHAKGTLDEIQNLPTLPDGFKEVNTSADVHLTPDGKFLYVSNRGYDGITRFEVNSLDGRLTPLGFTPTIGKTPRNFEITSDGRLMLVANQNSDSIVIFQIDPANGDIKPNGVSAELRSPVCIKAIVS